MILELANGSDDLKMWRLVANTLNKQSWTADKGLSSSLGVGQGANPLAVSKEHVTKCYAGYRTWVDYLA